MQTETTAVPVDGASKQATHQFIRVCAAATCILLATSLMNVAVFPLFDPLFTYARDISVVANAVTLVALGLVGTLRPAWLHSEASFRIVVVSTVVGSLLLLWSLALDNAWLLTVSACIVAMARGWAMVAVGVAASRLDSRRIALCIVLAFVAYYLFTALLWVIPSGVGVLAFLILPMVAFALVWRDALRYSRRSNVARHLSMWRSRSPHRFFPWVASCSCACFCFVSHSGFRFALAR